MMKSVLIDSFAVWWIAIPTLQNYDTSMFASLSNSLSQSVHHVVRIHRKRQHLQHHHGQPRKIFWDIYLKECPPCFHVPTIRNIYDMIRSFVRTQHDQVQIHLHTPGLFAKRHAFVFNTSALISALVLSSDSKLTGRWPTRNSSRTSDLVTSSRCRPTSENTKITSCSTDTAHLTSFGPAAHSSSEFRSSFVLRLSASSSVPSLSAPTVGNVWVLPLLDSHP